MNSKTFCSALALAGLIAAAEAHAQISLLAQLKSPHPEADSNFGASVAEGSMALAVGQPGATYDGLPAVGAAYLYDFIHYDAPVELRAEHSIANAHYGASLSGQVLVGAPGGSAVDGDPAPRGVVESWQYAPDFLWTRDGLLAPPDTALGTGFGTSVSAMAFQAVVGFPGYLDGGRVAGAAMLFDQNSLSWQYDGSFISSHDGTGFASVVWMDGTRLLVGEPGFGDGDGATGLISYYDGGLPSGTLSSGDGQAQGFGGSAIWANNMLLVGVPYPDDIDGQPSQGRVYAYSRDFQSGDYVLIQTLIAPDGFPGDGFGASIDLWGFTFAIGTPGMSVLGHENAGAVWLFDNFGFNFTVRERKISPHPAANARFGQALTWASGRLAIGAPGDPNADLQGAGSVYVFGNDPDVIFQGFFDPGF